MQGHIIAFAVLGLGLLYICQAVEGTYTKTDSYTYTDLEFNKKVTIEYRYSSDLLAYQDAVEDCNNMGEGWTLMNNLGYPFTVQKMFELVVPDSVSQVWVLNYDKSASCMIVTRTKEYQSNTGQPVEGCTQALRRGVCNRTTKIPL